MSHENPDWEESTRWVRRHVRDAEDPANLISMRMFAPMFFIGAVSLLFALGILVSAVVAVLISYSDQVKRESDEKAKAKQSIVAPNQRGYR